MLEAFERAQMASKTSEPPASAGESQASVPAPHAQAYKADVPQAAVQEARVSSDDLNQLERIAQRALGPVPMDATGYRAMVTRRVSAPGPGCVQMRIVPPGKGTLVRWRCPKGTIRRLGH